MVVVLHNVRLHNSTSLWTVTCGDDGGIVKTPVDANASNGVSKPVGRPDEWYGLQDTDTRPWSITTPSSSGTDAGTGMAGDTPETAGPGGSVTTIDCKGTCILLPALTTPHLHIDKAYLLDRTPLSSGGFSEALSKTTSAKADFTPADVARRIDMLVERLVSNGVTRGRWFVEIDPIVRHVCLDAVKEVLQRCGERMRKDVQVCVFVQDPIYKTTTDDDDKDDDDVSKASGATFLSLGLNVAFKLDDL